METMKVMKREFVTFLLLGVFHIFTQFGTAQTIKSSDKKLENLGRADQLAYVDIDKLPIPFERGEKDLFNALNSKLKPSSFFQSFNWNPTNCWAGGVLREGVVAYCLPYLQLGQYLSLTSRGKPDRFVPVTGSQGVFVWYETKNNSYYMWGSGWNFEFALGPFTGEPIAALTRAVKPRKEKRSFPGVKLELRSQGWTFPDMKEPPPPAPCMTNYCPQYEIINKYHQVTTRLRLVNHGKKTIYYLADNSEAAAPSGFGLSKKIGNTDWENSAFLKMTGIGGTYTRWMPFAPNAAVDFELVGQGFKKYEYAYVVVLNDEPVYWDEVNLIKELPVILRETKSESLFR